MRDKSKARHGAGLTLFFYFVNPMAGRHLGYSPCCKHSPVFVSNIKFGIVRAKVRQCPVEQNLASCDWNSNVA